MPSLTKLFPNKGVSWSIWFLLMLIVFPYFYAHIDVGKLPGLPLSGQFSDFQSQYREGWQSCAAQKNQCAMYSKQGDFRFYYDIPKWVADFWAMPLTVRVERVLKDTEISVAASTSVSMTQPIIIGLTLSPTLQTDDFLIKSDRSFDLSEQNSISLPDLTPGAQASAVFYIRMFDETQSRTPLVYLNGEVLDLPLDTTIAFNRLKVFQLWLIENLLTPPGANIFLPVGLLLFVRIGEWAAECTSKHKAMVVEREASPGKFSAAMRHKKTLVQHLPVLFVFLLGAFAARAIDYVWDSVFGLLMASVSVSFILGLIWGVCSPVPEKPAVKQLPMLMIGNRARVSKRNRVL